MADNNPDMAFKFNWSQSLLISIFLTRYLRNSLLPWNVAIRFYTTPIRLEIYHQYSRLKKQLCYYFLRNIDDQCTFWSNFKIFFFSIFAERLILTMITLYENTGILIQQ